MFQNLVVRSLKRFLAVVFFAVSFGAASFALAAGHISLPQPSAILPLPGTSYPKAITVATVNVQDVTLVKQEGNVFTLSFNIFNKEGIQPKIIYSVSLLKREGKEFTPIDQKIDQKIYDRDVLSLGANDSVHKVITYIAPAYLKGTYSIVVEARNPDALILGNVPLLDAVTLGGTNEYIYVDLPNCFLTVDGEVANTHYNLSQGVDISKEETLTAHCSLTNTFKTDQTVVPVFETRYRSVFGKLINTEKREPLTLKPNKKTDFTAKLPKTIESQAYDAVLTFVDEKNERLSSPIVFHYVLRGESATIQNLVVDKDYYQEGETAKVTFFWTGNADSFQGSRLVSTNNPQIISATFTLTDDQKNPCAEPFIKSLNAKNQGGVENISIPATRDCRNPVISAKIADQSGKIFAENSYDIQSKNVPKAKANLTGGLVTYTFVFLLIFALIIYLVKKNKRTGMAVLFGLVIGLGILTAGHEARAATFYVVTPFSEANGVTAYITTTFYAAIDKSVYAPGSTIYAQTVVTSATCNNTVNVTGRIIALSSIWIMDAPSGCQNLNNVGVQSNSPYRQCSYGDLSSTINSGFLQGYFVAPYRSGSYNAQFDLGTKFGNGLNWSSGNMIRYTVAAPPPPPPPPPCADTSWSPSTSGTCTTSTLTQTSNCGNSRTVWGTMSCPVPVNGAGGPACGKTYSSSETGYGSDTQCSVGSSSNTAFPPQGGSVSWTCSGSNGGSNASCSASRQAATVPVNGVGGSACGKTYSSSVTGYGSDTQCSVGSSSNTAFPPQGGSVSWTCSGSNGGSSASCSASRQAVAVPVNGACGPANGVSSVTEPITPSLCGAGTPSAVTKNTVTNKWEWSCSGSSGGANASCSAPIKRQFKFIQF